MTPSNNRQAREEDVEENHCGQKELQDRVVRAGLCTGCGACVGLCPYQASHEDRLVFLNRCDLKSGRCHAYCPRTPTDLHALRKALFDRTDLTSEIGAVRGFYLARARDPRVRERAQHGGSVTALVHLALKEGLIGEAVLTGAGEDLLPQEMKVDDPEEVSGLAKSRFVVSPVLGLFNRMAVDLPVKIGIVATPCQALALAKMRLKTDKSKPSPVDRLKFVIGLFCGWALSWEKLRRLLQEKAGTRPILGMDIPPSRYHSLDVHTATGTITVSLDEVTPCVREACWSCFDMTAEFTDISIGSARLPEGWEEARRWNQIIVRTKEGEELLALAKTREILEFRDVPEGNLDRLKQASMNKKRAAVRNLVKRSGSEQDLIYLDRRDPTLRTW